ncbi:hypothetical protein B8X04_02745 [Brevibacterium casei]|uniref:Uncharacterized protein n=1 Tax=Brevibacterium casei TaxID=33889 RepID=A0A269ZH78_9MICO|nr:hypothetical protein B8X04_02745 [Brevibacterium casei]
MIAVLAVTVSRVCARFGPVGTEAARTEAAVTPESAHPLLERAAALLVASEGVDELRQRGVDGFDLLLGEDVVDLRAHSLPQLPHAVAQLLVGRPVGGVLIGPRAVVDDLVVIATAVPAQITRVDARVVESSEELPAQRPTGLPEQVGQVRGIVADFVVERPVLVVERPVLGRRLPVGGNRIRTVLRRGRAAESDGSIGRLCSVVGSLASAVTGGRR